MTVFNAPLIHQARLTSGLPIERVARRSGVNNSFIEAVERGTPQDLRNLPVSVVIRWAELIGLTLPQMFDTTAPPSPAAAPDETVTARWHRDNNFDDSARALAAVLLTRSVPVRNDDVLAALPTWDNVRLRGALAAANVHLQPLAMRIDRKSAELRVLPLEETDAPALSLDKAVMHRTGVPLDAYRLAHKAIAGPAPVSMASWRTRVQTGTLTNQGIAQMDQVERTITLTPAARMGLLLTE